MRLESQGNRTWELPDQNLHQVIIIAYFPIFAAPACQRQEKPSGHRSTAEGLCPEIPEMVTISVDEKPGVQAIKNIAKDFAPVAGEHSAIGRDYEYKRLGTVSILAALDRHTGHVIAQVHNRYRSREFISLLQELDAYYNSECIIRVILDNHSAHISKETLSFLKIKPNRFVYVHKPKHGSWLNLLETLFGRIL